MGKVAQFLVSEKSCFALFSGLLSGVTAVFPQPVTDTVSLSQAPTVAGEKSSIPQAHLFEGNLSISLCQFSKQSHHLWCFVRTDPGVGFNYLDWDLIDFPGVEISILPYCFSPIPSNVAPAHLLSLPLKALTNMSQTFLL